MKLAILAVLGTLVLGTTVTVFNDIHLDPGYQPNGRFRHFCRDPESKIPNPNLGLEEGSDWEELWNKFNGNIITDRLELATYGCDSSRRLVETMFSKAVDVNQTPDVVLMSGDYAAHGYAAYHSQHNRYDELKAILADVIQIATEQFPDSALIPAIGNNDAKWHNEFANTEEEAKDYYGFLYQEIFQNHPTNSKYAKLSDIEETFMHGGYYRYEVGDTTFIALNTLYFDTNSAKLDHRGIDQDQMKFIEDTLEAGPDRKFVLNFHFFPSSFADHPNLIWYWEQKYISWFEGVVSKYSDRIVMIAGAHTHWGQMFAQKPKSVGQKLGLEDPKWAMLLTPGLSQMVYNNPGFTTFKVSEKAHSVQFHFLDLMHWYIFESLKMITFDFEKEFGVKDFTPANVLKHLDSLEGSRMSTQNYFRKMVGFPMEMTPLSSAMFALLGYQTKTLDSSVYFCISETLQKEDYDRCH